MKELLQDKVAVITGGTAGIGKAIAMRFASSGALVVILGSDASRGEAALKEIQAIHPAAEPRYVQADVGKGASVAAAMKEIYSAFGRVDILVNNAGITRDQLFMKMSEEEWHTVLNVNLDSCFYTCKEVVRPMLKAKKGKIINVSSVVGICGNPGQVNYAASKAAMIGFTKSLAKELASRQICVNCLAPGFVSTQMTDSLTEAQKEKAVGEIPMGRFGQPDEIANAALFLASGLSDYMTGQTLVVDGGLVM